jgi:hypothetical protein
MKTAVSSGTNAQSRHFSPCVIKAELHNNKPSIIKHTDYPPPSNYVVN